MKQLVLVAIILLFTGIYSACEKSTSELCGGDQPDKNLPWLKNEIETLSSSPFCNSISRSTYRNQTVFIFSICEPNVDSIPQLYTCDGKKLDLTTKDYQDLSFTGPIDLIWKNR